MSPIMKKALSAVAAKQVIDKINEKRNPKKSSKFGRFLLLAAGAGALYAYKSGKLQPLIDRVRGQDPSGSAASASNGAGKSGEMSFSSESQSLGSPVA